MGSGGQSEEGVHGSDEIAEALAVDDRSGLDVHDQVVQNRPHDSHLAVSICLTHVGEGGETGRGQGLAMLQRIGQEVSFRYLRKCEVSEVAT